MSALLPPVSFQIISGNGEAIPVESSAIEEISNNQAVYRIVAVFGRQNGGKTTLINHLTGSTMPVMRAGVRQATTHGVHAVILNQWQLLILDFEGTDSSQQADPKLTGTMLGLLAMVTCDLVVINVNDSELALDQGSGFPLLQAIIKAKFNYARISKSRHQRTGILFAIRDYDPEADMAGEDSTLTWLQSRCKEEWAKVQELDYDESFSFDEHFTVDIHKFPHARLQRQPFIESVEELRNRLVKPTDSLLTPSCSRGIPLVELPSYFKSIWEGIKKQADCEVALAQQGLSQGQCQKIYDDMACQLHSLFLECRSSLPPLFEGPAQTRTQVLEIEHKIQDEYDCRTASYSVQDALQYATRLKADFGSLRDDLYKRQLDQLKTDLLQDATRQYDNKRKESAAEFGNFLSGIKGSCIKRFESVTLDLGATTIPGISEIRKCLEQDLIKFVMTGKSRFMKHILGHLQTTSSIKIKEIVRLAFVNIVAPFWLPLLGNIQAACLAQVEQLKECADYLSLDSAECDTYQSLLHSHQVRAFKIAYSSHTTEGELVRMMLDKANRVMGKDLLNNEQENISSAFDLGRHTAQNLLSMLSTVEYDAEVSSFYRQLENSGTEGSDGTTLIQPASRERVHKEFTMTFKCREEEWIAKLRKKAEREAEVLRKEAEEKRWQAEMLLKGLKFAADAMVTLASLPD
ncbi:related to Protein sey1-Schizosaccharomyces pombe [Serendipita indica DSM 11827]|uniref:Related to Protein sey1-Schizosaccharomyces pombe n=1 Tax=Serendipita indica (strain DSM 11827) TaxID=1109443 RepID=G4TW58_SERID|nr:related to Protein sey1-Schizosaccharomyces pombe [Serendipita indica DSM 11827]